MPYETLTGGLELVLPTNSTTNWGTVLKNSTWQKINDHQHTGSGDGNPLTAASFSANVIGQAALSKNLALTQQSYAPSGTTETIDFDLGNKVILDLTSTTGDITLTLNNPIAGAEYRIKIIQHATVRTITWPAAVFWPQAEEPSQFSQNSWVDMVILDYDGTNYLGSWDLNLS